MTEYRKISPAHAAQLGDVVVVIRDGGRSSFAYVNGGINAPVRVEMMFEHPDGETAVRMAKLTVGWTKDQWRKLMSDDASREAMHEVLAERDVPKGGEGTRPESEWMALREELDHLYDGGPLSGLITGPEHADRLAQMLRGCLQLVDPNRSAG